MYISIQGMARINFASDGSGTYVRTDTDVNICACAKRQPLVHGAGKTALAWRHGCMIRTEVCPTVGWACLRHPGGSCGFQH